MLKKTYFEITRFGIAGGVSAIVNLSLVYFFTDIVGIWYLLGSIFSYILAAVVNFLLQKYFVMRNRSSDEITTQVLSYAALVASSLLLNILMMYIFVSLMAVYYLAAQAITIVALSVINYLVGKYYIFNNDQEA